MQIPTQFLSFSCEMTGGWPLWPPVTPILFFFGVVGVQAPPLRFLTKGTPFSLLFAVCKLLYPTNLFLLVVASLPLLVGATATPLGERKRLCCETSFVQVSALSCV